MDIFACTYLTKCKGKSPSPREVNASLLLTCSSSLTKANFLRRFKDLETARATH